MKTAIPGFHRHGPFGVLVMLRVGLPAKRLQQIPQGHIHTLENRDDGQADIPEPGAHVGLCLAQRSSAIRFPSAYALVPSGRRWRAGPDRGVIFLCRTSIHLSMERITSSRRRRVLSTMPMLPNDRSRFALGALTSGKGAMHVVFLHQNFPAQFGPFLSQLGGQRDWRFTFVSRYGEGTLPGVERLIYDPRGGATRQTHYFSRTFENVTWHSAAAYHALKLRPDIQPDLIVAHSGFLTAVPLRELYPDCPIVNLFEYFYRTRNSDIDFRPDEAPRQIDKIRARFRNAAILLDLESCDAGYSPTAWQRSRFPQEFQEKIRVIFDGIDTRLWYPRPRQPRRAGRFSVPDDVQLVTYVARGFESIRGFDIFMRFAKKLYLRRSDVRFLVIGEDKVHYGGDLKRTEGMSFKDWVLSQDEYDMTKFAFVGRVPPDVLAQALSISDLHIYLTVPFVVSWSLFNAMACGATILASDTEPVREVIQHGANGLLVDFFDVEAMAETAAHVLEHPESYRHLGQQAVADIHARYSLDVCLPRFIHLFEETASRRSRHTDDSP